MRCPACSNVPSPTTVGGITVDVCKDGCAGIWFDRYELMKVDESYESAGEELTRIEGDPEVLSALDHTKRLSCPKTPNVMMRRHFLSVKRQVAVDECPECGEATRTTGVVSS
jgi:Zn-finger nucleic acid-binding protein